MDAYDQFSQQARQALTEGNGAQARQAYMKALAERPDAPDAHYGVATACFLLSDLETAAFHFKEVTRLDPLRPGAFINLGAVYNRLGLIDEAIKVLRRGIQLDSRRAEAYYNLGLAYRRNNQHELAVQAYREATHLNPRMADAHYNLANLLLELGRYSQAIAHYKQSLEISPRFEKARIGLNQAEAALQAEQAPPDSNHSANLPAKSPSTTDLERTLDPFIDGPLLTNMHKATISTENFARDFLKLMEEKVEPSIKELSSALLNPEKAGGSLLDRVEKFERALQSLRGLNTHVQSSVGKLRELSDKLMLSQEEMKLKS